ncbi:MAG: hypothetical protein COU73_01460 [Parcubacteria group bacterium CG10_big_fil_rev_8_21_14_0_10_46_32]|nr:MAG: hypothetical protein COU73_01460 [Parcubacteria group bacterium CG10_big_fil_rev_8_21_14_0_10_46_32]
MTIFITIAKGLIARNLLQNDFYALVKKHFDKVVVLSTAWSDERFVTEFGGSNVVFLPLPQAPDTFASKLIGNLSRYIIYNGRTEMMSAYNFDRGKDVPVIWWYPKYLILKAVFVPLSKITSLRKLLRKIDVAFLHKKTVAKYRALIKEHAPNVVFVSNIVDNTEAALVKAARRERVPSVAMVKSWDNFSKQYFGASADTFAVWNQFMAEQAHALQDYKKEAIAIVGVPQFDYYADHFCIVPREVFCKRAGLDPNKKIIFFGSEGKLMPTDPNIVEVMRDFIKNNELAEECQVFVRPHFAYTHDREKFKDFFSSKEVVVDASHKSSSGFSDGWDYSREQMEYFLNAIHHAAVVVNTASTLTADALALNRPVILIAFEGYEKKTTYESVAGWYTSDYYQKIVSFHAALMADSVARLRSAINECLADPDILSPARKKFKDYFCFKVDGGAGKRLFSVVYQETNSIKN